MAKIENFDKIRRTIIVLKHDPEKISQEMLKQAERLLREYQRLIHEIGRFYDVYVPDRHPIIERRMLRNGRLIELGNVRLSSILQNGDSKKVMSENKSLFLVETMSEINDLTNILSDNILSKLSYDGEKYHRISGVIWDEKEIVRMPGVEEKNL